jgi:PKD repeat protein
MKYHLFYIAFSFLFLAACQPDQDDNFSLGTPPAAPDFSVVLLPGVENRVVLQDLSAGQFQRLWDAPGANPNNSRKVLDTIAFAKAGTYDITLHVSKADGSGSALATKKITILQDAPLTCNPKLALLTGDCLPSAKCWTLSKAPGAVKVGPTYDDFSWFTSIANGLQNEQYDDGFCFKFDQFVFTNKNNGTSVNPWNGYQAEPYAPGVSSFTFSEGTGILSRDQIILDDSQFMGVWDCDNVLDVVKLTSTQLVVRGRQREKNGTPKTEGWFELSFVGQ